MQFFQLSIITGLVVLAAIAGCGILIQRYIRHLRRFNSYQVALNRSYMFSHALLYLKHGLLGLAVILLGIAVLRPQWGVKTISSESRGIDIVFTLDVSQSMRATDLSILGQDVDRLTMAKSLIQSYVEENPQNRYGLVIFAGEAFVTTPLTLDETAFLTFLEGVNYTDVREQGTNIEEALKASIERFRAQDAEKRGNAIILMSDGGEEDSGNYQEFAGVAQEEGILVYTIGIGSARGVPIPDGQDLFGRTQYKTYQGQTVYTKLNEKPLKDIASITGGSYYHAKTANDLSRIQDRLNGLKTSVLSQETGTEVEERYQLFVFSALACFLGFLFIPGDYQLIKNIIRKLHITKTIVV